MHLRARLEAEVEPKARALVTKLLYRSDAAPQPLQKPKFF